MKLTPSDEMITNNYYVQFFNNSDQKQVIIFKMLEYSQLDNKCIGCSIELIQITGAKSESETQPYRGISTGRHSTFYELSKDEVLLAVVCGAL